MAQVIIQMALPEGEPPIFRIALVSDEDTTPREHEQDHRRLVRAILPGIDLDGDGSPRFEVEREKPMMEPPPPCSCGDDGYEVIDLG
jgi:hypothetical protein